VTVKCIVVGHGPSIDYELIKNFDGIVLSTDICTTDLIKHGIIPDYQLFAEIKEGIIKFILDWLPDSFQESQIRSKMTVVYREKAIPVLASRIGRLKLKSILFNADYQHYNAINNVGLYSVSFADIILKADEIHLTGLDYGHSDQYVDDVKSDV